MSNASTMMPPAHTHRSAALLRVARWLVTALALLAFAYLVAGTFLFPAYARVHSAEFTLSGAWTPETMAAAVDQLGWPSMVIPWYQYARGVINFAVYVSLGVLLLARGPRSWFGAFVALVFIASGYSDSYIRAVAEVVPSVQPILTFMSGMGWQLAFILFYVFPDGRFVPRWTRWLLVLWLGLNVGYALGYPVFSASWWIPMLLVATAIGSQVYRYFWRAGPVERTQTKWVVFVIALLAPVSILYVLSVPIQPEQAPATDQLASTLVTTLAWQTVSWVLSLLIPISIAIAITRYRLWDIDVVIRRTLVYATLTALLGLIFYGSIVLFQSLFTGITGETSPVAVVASTLVIAALFSRLRLPVQDFVDRRFYRPKYNAQQVLAKFAIVARDETDLTELTSGLAAAVAETVKPDRVGIWTSRS